MYSLIDEDEVKSSLAGSSSGAADPTAVPTGSSGIPPDLPPGMDLDKMRTVKPDEKGYLDSMDDFYVTEQKMLAEVIALTDPDVGSMDPVTDAEFDVGPVHHDTQQVAPRPATRQEITLKFAIDEAQAKYMDGTLLFCLILHWQI